MQPNHNNNIPSLATSFQSVTGFPSNISFRRYGKHPESSSSLELPFPLSVLSLRLQFGGINARLMAFSSVLELGLLLSTIWFARPPLFRDTSTVTKLLRDKCNSWSVFAWRRRNQTASQVTFVPIKMSTESRGSNGNRNEFSIHVDVREQDKQLKLRFRNETDGVYCRILDTFHIKKDSKHYEQHVHSLKLVTDPNWLFL